MKNKTNVYFVLPSNIKGIINSIEFPTKKGKNKAKKFIALLLKKGLQDNFDLEQFREIPSKYMKKAYGNNYSSEFLDILETTGVVQVNHVYSNFDTQKFSKSYRLQPTLIEAMEDFDGDSYINEREGCETFEEMPIYTRVLIDKKDGKYSVQPVGTLAYMWSKTTKDLVRNDLNSLTYDATRIFEKTKEVVSNICGPKFKVDEAVTDVFFEVYNRKTGHKYWTSKENAIAKAAEYGLTLIQDKRKYYIDDLDRYVTLKQKNILLNYKAYAKKMEKGIYGVSRNTTNNRLDHLLTNVCKHTIDIIKEDNDLVEIDMRNSQFTILSNWMKELEVSNAEEFYSLSTQGTLYPTLAYMWSKTEITSPEALKKASDAAKISMMSVMFSSHKNHSEDKSQFKGTFPSVVDFIDSYKKKSTGSEQFAIELQKREAQMFVDDLWVNIKRAGFFCLTKHDSLLVRRSDMNEVLDIIKAYFNYEDFEGTVKCDDLEIPISSDTELITDPVEAEQVECLVEEETIQNEPLNAEKALIAEYEAINQKAEARREQQRIFEESHKNRVGVGI